MQPELNPTDLRRLDLQQLTDYGRKCLEGGDPARAIILFREAARRAPFRQDLREWVAMAVEALASAPKNPPRPRAQAVPPANSRQAQSSPPPVQRVQPSRSHELPGIQAQRSSVQQAMEQQRQRAQSPQTPPEHIPTPPPPPPPPAQPPTREPAPRPRTAEPEPPPRQEQLRSEPREWDEIGPQDEATEIFIPQPSTPPAPPPRATPAPRNVGAMQGREQPPARPSLSFERRGTPASARTRTSIDLPLDSPVQQVSAPLGRSQRQRDHPSSYTRRHQRGPLSALLMGAVAGLVLVGIGFAVFWFYSNLGAELTSNRRRATLQAQKFEAAANYLRRGEYTLAIDELRSIEQSARRDKELARIFYEQGHRQRMLREPNYNAVIEDFRQALEYDPRNVNYGNALGEAYYSRAIGMEPRQAREWFEKARQTFETVLAIEPNNVQALDGLARTANKLRDDVATAEAYRQIIKIAPDSGEAEKARNVLNQLGYRY